MVVTCLVNRTQVTAGRSAVMCKVNCGLSPSDVSGARQRANQTRRCRPEASLGAPIRLVALAESWLRLLMQYVGEGEIVGVPVEVQRLEPLARSGEVDPKYPCKDQGKAGSPLPSSSEACCGS